MAVPWLVPFATPGPLRRVPSPAMVRRLRGRGVAASAGVVEGGRLRQNVAPRKDGGEDLPESTRAGANVGRAEQEAFGATRGGGGLDLRPRHGRRHERPRRRPE